MPHRELRSSKSRAVSGLLSAMLPVVVSAMTMTTIIGLAACAPKVAPRTRPPAAIPRTTVPAVVGVQPGILSAQHRAPTRADLEEGRSIAAVVYLVLSVEVDPTTLDPEHFVVSLDDGRRRRPARVLLTAASEGDENRTLILAIERPKGAEEVRPLAVTITGPVFGEGGEVLSGLAAEIDEASRPPRLVYAVREVAEEGACAGASQAVRTFWSVPLDSSAALDLAAVAVTLDDSAVVHPTAVDDHGHGHERGREGLALQGDDNVVDFCVSATTPAKQVAVEGDLFRDHFGLASAAGEVAVQRAPRT